MNFFVTLFGGGEFFFNGVFTDANICIKFNMQNVISIETYRYLFSALSQTLGAIIAISASFFIIKYSNLYNEKNNYYIRLTKFLFNVKQIKTDYIINYKNKYVKKEEALHADIDGYIKLKTVSNMKIIYALRSCSSDYDFLNESHSKETLYPYVQGNISEHQIILKQIRILRRSIIIIYMVGISSILVLSLLLAFTDIVFNTQYIIYFVLGGLAFFLLSIIAIFFGIIKSIKS